MIELKISFSLKISYDSQGIDIVNTCAWITNHLLLFAENVHL